MKNKTAIIFVFSVLASLAIVTAFDLNDRRSIRECNDQCSVIQKEAKLVCLDNYPLCLNPCGIDRSCKTICSKEKMVCLKEADEEHKDCRKQCILNTKKGCLNETYRAGESFIRECEICECKGNEKISCKRDAFCNKNASVNEQECISGGGFYQALCNGPYFDIVCSQQEFCICGGVGNYTCAEDYECLYDFISPNKRVHTIAGWKTLLGRPLGKIGVCVK